MKRMISSNPSPCLMLAIADGLLGRIRMVSDIHDVEVGPDVGCQVDLVDDQQIGKTRKLEATVRSALV